MEMTIQILAPELAGALNNLAAALEGRYIAPMAEEQTNRVVHPAEPEMPDAKPEKTKAETEADPTEEDLRRQVKSLGIKAVRAKKTGAVKKLLDALGVTELKDIPASKLAAFKADMEGLVNG
ncbi:MAG: hypothetical protein IJU41_03510 [Clostridia bacterium]|nr:hypothetical protein [Clostridia bacterium]